VSRVPQKERRALSSSLIGRATRRDWQTRPISIVKSSIERDQFNARLARDPLNLALRERVQLRYQTFLQLDFFRETYMGLFEWLKSQFAPSSREPSFRLLIDESGVKCERAGGLVEFVAWDDLQKVAIVTTDEGPFGEDVFFVLHGCEDGCVVPQSAPHSDALLERLQALPGFDNESVVQAMGCVDNHEFVCWDRAGTPV